MQKKRSLYHGHRFPAVVISQAVRWYFRLQLSLHDIEELLFERGVVVSPETIRRWCDKFGAGFAHGAKVPFSVAAPPTAKMSGGAICPVSLALAATSRIDSRKNSANTPAP
jgi:hypothetical protein